RAVQQGSQAELSSCSLKAAQLCRRERNVLQGRLITRINRIRADRITCWINSNVELGIALRSVRPNDLKLGQRQEIAIGILEPSNLAGGGRDPYAELGLLQSRKSLERHTFVLQVSRGRLDVGNLPAEQREREWRETIDLLNPQGRPASL